MAGLTTNWYVFFSEKKDPLKPKSIRIGASCLGDAATTAIEWASRCNIDLIGVAPDIGVAEVS